MAPEQCAPGEAGRPGHASDVWGLGTTLFHAIAGHRPFDEGDPDADDLRDRYPQLVDHPCELPDDAPAAVVKIVAAMLEDDPDDRPLPHEVAAALQPVLEAQPAAQLTFKVRR